MSSALRPATLALIATASLGLAGAILQLAGVESPLTGPLTLLFLLAEPALAVALLLPGLTPLARTIVAGSMSVVVNGTVSEVMLAVDAWSPRGGVAAVAVICGALAAIAAVLGVRHVNGAQPAEAHDEDEEWLFEG